MRQESLSTVKRRDVNQNAWLLCRFDTPFWRSGRLADALASAAADPGRASRFKKF
jgi:hypothetical protein